MSESTADALIRELRSDPARLDALRAVLVGRAVELVYVCAGSRRQFEMFVGERAKSYPKGSLSYLDSAEKLVGLKAPRVILTDGHDRRGNWAEIGGMLPVCGARVERTPIHEV